MPKGNFKRGINKFSENLIKNDIITNLRSLGYKIMDFEVPINFGKMKKYVDIVVYSIENGKKSPFIVVEYKYPKIDEFSWIQVESYAKRLKTPFFAVTNGDEWLWYKTGDKIGDSETVDVSYLNDMVSESDYSLIKFESQDAFLRIINECYDIIRSNIDYKKDELVFELIKIILTKIKDENDIESKKKTNKEFLIVENDDIISVSMRIRKLFDEFKSDFLKVYPNFQYDGFNSINLANNLIYELVKVLEPYKFQEKKQCDNLKGLIFDVFTKKAVKNQYFTPQVISHFMIDFI